MPDQPVDDHSEEFEQLAGLAALHLLEDDELDRFEQHVDHCQRCRLLLKLDMQALAGVSLISPEMDPSPDFKARLMRRAAAELAASASSVEATRTPRPEVAPLRPPPNVLPFRRRRTWLSLLAAVLVVGLVSVSAYSYQNQAVATYPLSGSAVAGSASVVLHRSGAAELNMQGVPDPGPGFVYEAWVIPAGPGAAPLAAGTIAGGNARLALPGVVPGSTVAVTRERGRVDVPTSAPLMAAVIQS